MESIITSIIKEWGSIGLVVAGLGYLIYDNWKTAKHRKDNNEKNTLSIQIISDKIDNINDKVSIVDKKVDDVTDIFDKRIDSIEATIDSLPDVYRDEVDKYRAEKQDKHDKVMQDLVNLGPNLHDVLRIYNDKIKSDHIFIGSFHNGSQSITGIPYYKFDIIAERFKSNMIKYDCEFACMYKDADILRFNKLPLLLMQKELVYFDIKDDEVPALADYDDIIWRRMKGRGIYQIALKLLRDKSNKASGFVGVVKYDHEELNLSELNKCGEELERIYHRAENNIK